jgi:SAM-dependent methyltransferase
MVAQHENLEAETMLQLRTLTRDVAVNKEQLETQKHEWSKRFEAQHQALQNEFETAIRIAIRQVKGELMEVMSESQSATQSAVKELAAELERLNQMLQLTRAEVTIRRAESAESPSTTTTESITTDDNRLDSLYASLEDRFRGSPDEIKERFSLYLPFIRQACTGDNPRVVDLGCGRGEWLELLQREKISAHGVDTNRIFLSRCRESGFDVTEEDVLTYLGTLETASISAVTGFHIIEHLPFDYLVRLLDEVMRVLRAGGLILFETPNPDNVLVGSNFFYFDPSHRHPLPSSLMELLLETRGFAEIEIKNLHPWDSGRVLGRGELAERFNGLFYGPMDYAILGWKPQA